MPITSTAFKPGNEFSVGRPVGARNKSSYALREKLKERGDKDPAEFLSEIVSDEAEAVEIRIAAADKLMPYYHSKLGAIPIPPDPTFMEIKLKNIDPSTVDQCVENINQLTQSKASGEISIEHADSLIADQKVILYAMLDERKQVNTEGGAPEQTIKIEGGLPQLPGTNVIMPDGPSMPGEPLSADQSLPVMNGHGSNQDP